MQDHTHEVDCPECCEEFEFDCDYEPEPEIESETRDALHSLGINARDDSAADIIVLLADIIWWLTRPDRPINYALTVQGYRAAHKRDASHGHPTVVELCGQAAQAEQAAQAKAEAIQAADPALVATIRAEDQRIEADLVEAERVAVQAAATAQAEADEAEAEAQAAQEAIYAATAKHTAALVAARAATRHYVTETHRAQPALGAAQEAAYERRVAAAQAAGLTLDQWRRILRGT